MQGLGDPWIAVPPKPFLERQRSPQGRLRLVEAAPRGERRAEIVERLGDLGALGPQGCLADGEGALEERHGVPLAGEAR
ncbi:MAG TPA: hypothetical protein VGG20_17580, partial [Thermoanaerobaculia bacterium]